MDRNELLKVARGEKRLSNELLDNLNSREKLTQLWMESKLLYKGHNLSDIFNDEDNDFFIEELIGIGAKVKVYYPKGQCNNCGRHGKFRFEEKFVFSDDDVLEGQQGYVGYMKELDIFIIGYDIFEVGVIASHAAIVHLHITEDGNIDHNMSEYIDTFIRGGGMLYGKDGWYESVAVPMVREGRLINLRLD